MCNNMAKDEILKKLTHSLPLYVFDEIDSTNRFAKDLTDTLALVVAKSQSMGRGRLGRSFISPKGGIYMSLRANIPDLYDNVPFITTAASVAVCKAIRSLYNKDVSIKWINDIYLNKKKVAGILCESSDSSHAIIGIGINFADYPKELENVATSLFDKKTSHKPYELIALITDNLLDILKKLPDTSFMEYYKAHSFVLGKRVLCIEGNQSFEATAVDITHTGSLVVKTDNGLKTLSTGEITLRVTD